MGLMIVASMLEHLKDKRVRLIAPMNDPNPIEVGSEGVVYNVGADIINVKWDNGRNLGLIFGEDQFELVENDKKTATTNFIGSEETANEIANEYNELLNTNSFKVERTNEDNVFRISGLVSEEDLNNFNIKDEFIIN